MGFFSAIKNFFGPKDTGPEKAPVVPEELENQINPPVPAAADAQPEAAHEPEAAGEGVQAGQDAEAAEEPRLIEPLAARDEVPAEIIAPDEPESSVAESGPGKIFEVGGIEAGQASEEVIGYGSGIEGSQTHEKLPPTDARLLRELRQIEKGIDAVEDDIHIIETEPNEIENNREHVAVEAELPVAEPAAPMEVSSENDRLLVRLREADPRLSAWLGIVLEEVDEAGDLLWARLRFLLGALEAPRDEVDAFVEDFRLWLERMEYRHVDEFRSELQYRLALALDLEDEEDERARLMVKLSQGLARTREQFGRRLDELFSSHGELDQAFWDELEELFIMADLGYETSVEMVERLKARAHRDKVDHASGARRLLREELEDIFRREKRIAAVNKPEVVLMIGVNGVGKTTTIAKLAHRERMRGKKTLIVAADTFRAAAIEQLQVWAERVGSNFFARAAGSDPASVAWEAMDYAKAHGIDVVYIDTAGRLQTKVNLMEELGKIRQVLGKKHPGAPHRSVLVLDATTGQNAISQAKLFKEAAGADELILTKLDGTAKGGVAIAVAMRENLPITFVGLGEKMEDLRPFSGEDYAAVLLGEKAA